jgi:hypothetical protein
MKTKLSPLFPFIILICVLSILLSAISPGSIDPAVDDSYTKVLLHFNGDDSSTTFTDESGKTWTTGGTVQLDQDYKVFGSASGLFDGDSDWIRTADSNDFYFAGNFTIDLRVRMADTGMNTFWYQYESTSSRSIFYFNANTLYYDARGGSGNILYSASWTPSTDTWYHLALVRSGNNLYFFVDGEQVGSTGTTSYTSPNVTAYAYIGLYATNYYGGWLDEFRLSNGIARWTSGFTPPAYEYGTTPATDTPTATCTSTDTPTATGTATDTPTATGTATDTPTATGTATDTPTATATIYTDTPSSTPTETLTPTITTTPGTATALYTLVNTISYDDIALTTVISGLCMIIILAALAAIIFFITTGRNK